MKNNKENKSIKKTISTTVQKLFSLLGFKDAKYNIKTKKESFNINISTDPETSGILIGYHGETISSLQLLLSLMINQKLSQWHHFQLNINDYREKKEQSLIEVAKNAAKRVISSNKDIIMPPMESYDRRIIHLTLSQEKKVKTQSKGTGRDRRLIISPSTKDNSKKPING